MRELQSAAADVRMIGRERARRRRRRPPRVPALVTGWPSTRHLAGQDQRPRPFARRRQPPFDDELIEADAWASTSDRARTPGWTPVRRPSSIARRSSGRCRAARVGEAARRPATLSARARHSARHPARRVEAVERRIRRLAGRGVLARRLAEIRRRALDVEDVVDDLKREAELRRRRVDRRPPARSLPPPMIAPAAADARISAPVFLRVHRAQRRRASSGGGARPCGSGVTHARSIAWPPTMPDGAGRRGDDVDHAQLARDQRRDPRARLAREQRETLRSAGRRRPGSPCPRRRRRAASAGRGASCRRPWPADRRG